MQGKRKFYDMEDDKNPFIKKITQWKSKRTKKTPKVQKELKSV